MQSVFIMGGTGFLGTEAVRALVARGDTVYGLARSPAAAQKLRQSGAMPIEGDVRTPRKWISTLPPIDYAINVLGFFNDGKPARLSVSFADKCHEKYTQWAQVLIQVAKERQVKAAVHVTGTTVFQEHPVDWITEKTPLHYGLIGFNRIARSATRLMVEGLEAGLPIIVAAAPNIVYGPVPGSSFESVFVDPLRMNMIGVVGSGKNYVPTGHVEDVGRAIAHLTDVKYAREYFLIAGDDAITQKEFLYAVAKGLGKKSVLQLPVPVVSVLGGKAAAEFMSVSQRVDNTKLKQTGFEFKYPRFLEEIGPTMKQLLGARHKAA